MVNVGKVIIGDLVDSMVALIPMAIDAHGLRGALLDMFLFGHRARKPLTFLSNRPNATIMHRWIATHLCPIGIATQACLAWQRNRSRWFYGHFHTALMPKEATLQQMDLVFTKAQGLHQRNATQKFGIKPEKLGRTASPLSSLVTISA